MMNLATFVLKKCLASAGLEIKRIPGASDRASKASQEDPLRYLYRTDMAFMPTVQIRLVDARAGVSGYAYGPGSANPLVVACLAGIAGESQKSTESNVYRVMKQYYGLVRPETALAVVDLDEEDAPGLVGIPICHWVLPWSEFSPAETARRRRICLEEEGLAQRRLVTIEDGATLFGPVSEKKLALETARVSGLVASFKSHGFCPDSRHPIEVIALRAGSEYRWFAVQGHHRLSICSAFDLKTVDARVTRIVRREDVAHWPSVVNKTFTAGGALQLFDRVFAGDTFRCAASWEAEQKETSDAATNDSQAA